MPARRPGRPPTPLPHYPNRLRATRERLGKSIGAVAKDCGITAQTLQKYETGDLQLKVKDLEKLARKLGVPASELLNSTNVPQDEQVRELLEIAHRLGNVDRRRLLKIARVIAEESKTETAPAPSRSS